MGTQIRKILVVDDVEESRYYLEALLRGHGYAVLAARNGAEALSLAQTEEVDLIISDVLMPVMDGFEFCRRCKQDDRLADIPFIFYTATYVDPKDQAFGLALGAERYLIKPLEPESLMQTFRDTVDSRRRERRRTTDIPLENDPVYLRQHNEVLIRKLEAKMIQLEKANQSLERELAERRQVENRLQRLHAAIENAGEGFLIADSGGIIEYVNPAFQETLGVPEEDMTGRSLEEMSGGARNSGFFLAMWENSRQSGPWKGCLTGKDKEGKRIEFATIISPIADPYGKSTGFVATFQDMTVQRDLESQLAQAQKMEAIGTLAGGIAHDFNNILAPISGFAEVALLDTPRESRVHHYLEQILTSGLRAKDLVKQILTFSRKSEEERIPVEASILVKETLRLLRSTLPATIEMRQKIHSDAARTTIIADPTQLHQVLMNLCANSAHAMREKGGVLEVGMTNLDVDADSPPQYRDMERGPYLKLTVSDTGHGMDKEVLPRIFDPYYTTKGPDEGTGLGLAVVYGIVKSLRGGITVSSEKDKGTTFEILFPSSGVAPVSAVVSFAPPPAGKGRILVVDDEKMLLELLEVMFVQLGYQITTSSNGVEALQIFSACPDKYDLVITDQTMPRMQGIDLARAMLKIRADIPIVLLTGFSDSVDEERARRLGVRGFLMKPVTWRDLAETVKQILAQESVSPR